MTVGPIGRSILERGEFLRAEVRLRREWSDALDDASRGDMRKLRALMHASVEIMAERMAAEEERG